MWTLSGTSFETLMIVFLRNGDFTIQSANSLSNFTGGLVNLQLKVNGQSILANRMELAYHPYEFYRQLAFGYGKKRFPSNNIPVNKVMTYAAGGVVGAAGALCNAQYLGLSTQDQWNCGTEVLAAATDNTIANRRQGTTVIMFSLADRLAMSGQNVKGGVAIRGMNVQLDYQFAAATPANQIINPYLFAVQDSLLILKGTSVATLQ